MGAFLAAVFMICSLGQSLAASDADRSAICGIIQDQIEAFKRDGAVRAYSYASPTLQSMFGSQELFIAMVREGYKPVYRLRSYTMGEFKDTPEGTSLSVQIQDLKGTDWVAIYTLEQQPDGIARRAHFRQYIQRGPSNHVHARATSQRFHAAGRPLRAASSPSSQASSSSSWPPASTTIQKV
jgi:hypothetical protein